MKHCCLLTIFVILFTASTCQAQALKASPGDWPWWRGPNGNGVAESGPAVPVEWDETKNVAWRAPVPGRGHSSPCVVGDRVLLTSADEQAQTQSVVCFDRRTGNELWRREVNREGFPKQIHPKNTHATPSIASDGTHLFASFLNHDRVHLVALSLDGQPLWERDAGKFTPKEYRNGYAASPVLFGDWVIVAADFDGESFLAAFDRATGAPSWRTPRPGKINYASPALALIGGRPQLLISGCDLAASYDPHNGKSLWQAAATSMATAATMVWERDLVFGTGGYPDPGITCLRADGSGKVVWQNKQSVYERSMIVSDGHLYAINDAGIAFCWDAATGQEKWHQRLRGPMSASPVLAGGNIYACDERGKTWVYRASPDPFKLLGQNQLGSEAFATPAICGGQIFLRVADMVDGQRRETLYCIQTP